MYSLIIVKFLLLSCIYTNAFPNVFEKCITGNSSDKLLKCVTQKALDNFNKMQNQDIVISPGITLKKNVIAARTAKNLDLNFNANNSTEVLQVLSESTSNFFNGRSLNIEIPLNLSTSIARAFEEGRAKMKKGMGQFFLGFGTRMMMSMMPWVFGGLTFFTAKALLVGKVALVLSAILFMETFLRGRFSSYGNSFGSYGPSYGYPPPTYGVPSTTYGVNFGTNSLGGGGAWGGSGPFSRSLQVAETEN